MAVLAHTSCQQVAAWVQVPHRLAPSLNVTQVRQDCGIAVAAIAGAVRVEVVILSQHVARGVQVLRVGSD